MTNKIALIALFSLAFCVLLQEYNLSYLIDSQSHKQGLITTADEASYFASALKWSESGVWKDSSIGYSSYYQRPPGYGWIFLLSNWLSPTHPYFILKILQILAMGFSVFLFGKILLELKTEDKWIFTSTLFFGLLPSFSGFTYYTLTESIVPLLILLAIFLTFKLRKEPTLFKIISFGILAGISLLIRPQLLILLLVLIAYILTQIQLKTMSKLFLVALFILPAALWSIRNYTVNDEWVGIHPIYHSSNNGMYRPIHKEMGDLFRIWESNTVVFHANMALLFSDTTENARITVISTLPENIRTSSRGKDILNVFNDYQLASCKLQNNFSRTELIPLNGVPLEKEATTNIRQLTMDLKSEFWVENTFKTPSYSLFKLVASSYLNLRIFQAKYRGVWWMEALRYFSFGVLFLSFLSSFYILFVRKNDLLLRFVAFAFLLTLFYLSFFQRLNEERYYYIFLPVIFLMLVHSLARIFRKE
ncbi:MAG TPA: hypothetical protein EYG86_01380 [Crocinitomicaceae bacterium]|nr:hypothetical protein [Crocinitomicaceae bacterium]